jgi:AcrR family transcriptional regulator
MSEPSIASSAWPLPSTGGRTRQKQRTQQALMKAALALRDEGREPTLQDVADRALVSRATAYRYFASIDDLLAMAHFERRMPVLEAVFKPGDDPVKAIGRACERVNRLLLEDERAARVLLRSAMQVWLDAPPERRPPRPGRRMRMIEPILEGCGERLSPAAKRRLRAALSLVMGVEAVISLRDVAGVSPATALAVSRAAAEALMRDALEASARERA